MVTRYGYASEAWDTVREEMQRLLIARARACRTIAYSELVEQVKTIRLEPDSHALAAILGEISEGEDAVGRGMLAVLVVHKDGDMRPGPGSSSSRRNWAETLPTSSAVG
jgi:hypothetical protein